MSVTQAPMQTAATQTAATQTAATQTRQSEPAAERPHEGAAGTVQPLGFIGLGAMGLPMACRLARAGHAVLACDTDPVRLAMFVEEAGQDARVHTSLVPGEVGERCAAVILMLPTSRHVEAVVLGSTEEAGGSLADTMAPGGLVIDMGSSIPGETRRLAAALEARDLRLIDAPVSGGVVKARAGTLSLLIGGAAADIERAMPWLQSVGEALIRTGPVGSGHAMKALNNYVYAAGLLATVEAARAAEAAGLDLDILTEVLNASSGRNVATETKLRQFIISGTYAGGFRLGLMAKDLETAGALAEETGVTMKSLGLCRDIWREAVAALGPDADNTEIHRCIRARRS